MENIVPVSLKINKPFRALPLGSVADTKKDNITCVCPDFEKLLVQDDLLHESQVVVNVFFSKADNDAMHSVTSCHWE